METDTEPEPEPEPELTMEATVETTLISASSSTSPLNIGNEPYSPTPVMKFHPAIIKTDVTSLKADRNLLFCGIGVFLHIFDMDTFKRVAKQQVLENVRIYGIDIFENQILVFGENILAIYMMNEDRNKLSMRGYHRFTDWLTSAIWTEGGKTIVVVTMHNIAEQYTVNGDLTKSVTCDEYCLLYCSCIVHDKLSFLTVFSGTIFSHVIIWRPFTEGGQVLKVLQGHEGVVFSIYHSDPYIVTSSEDKCVILWKCKSKTLNETLSKETGNIKLQTRITGHKARVFKCKLLNGNIISASEDGLVCIWNYSGKLLKEIKAHRGGSIWSIETAENYNVFITGGSDSAVVIYPIEPMVTIRNIPMRGNQDPKLIAFLSNGDYFVVYGSGTLYQYSIRKQRFIVVSAHTELKDYTKMHLTENKQKIILGGIKGHVFIYELIHDELILTCTHQMRNSHRIYEIQWLTDEFILSCGPNGWLFLWQHCKNELTLIQTMELPESKEPVFTSACLIPGGVVLGDRKGNIHYFDLLNRDLAQTLSKVHNHLGVAAMCYKHDDKSIISLGRDSTLARYETNKNELKLLSTDKLPYSWLVSFQRINEIPIVIAFHGNEIIYFDYKQRRKLYSAVCGGGHRSWDFFFENSTQLLHFLYLKDKEICVNSVQWKTIFQFDIISSFHISETNCMRIFVQNKHIYILSGGEDTTVRFSNFSMDRCTFNSITVLKSHISSVKAMHLILWHLYKYLLFTSGGRSQIIMWEIENDSIREVFTYYDYVADNDVRIMDMATIRSEEKMLLIAACSDGKIKFFIVGEDKLRLIFAIQYKLRCIMKLLIIRHLDFIILVTMSTDGILVFWNITKLNNTIRPFFKLSAHKSGINAISIRRIAKDGYFFLTGGDDNTISLSLLKFIVIGNNLSLKLLCHYRNNRTHSAQIAGVHIGSNTFYTAGLDQTVTGFTYSVSGATISTKCIGTYRTTIGDLKGMEVFVDNNIAYAFLYGLGIEVLKINMKVKDQNELKRPFKLTNTSSVSSDDIKFDVECEE